MKLYLLIFAGLLLLKPQLQAQQSLAVFNGYNHVRYKIREGKIITAIDSNNKKYKGTLTILDSTTIIIGLNDTIKIGSIERVNRYSRNNWGVLFNIGASGGLLLGGVFLNAGLRDPMASNVALLYLGALFFDIISLPPLFLGLHLIHRTNVKKGNYLKVIQSNY